MVLPSGPTPLSFQPLNKAHYWVSAGNMVKSQAGVAPVLKLPLLLQPQPVTQQSKMISGNAWDDQAELRPLQNGFSLGDQKASWKKGPSQTKGRVY